MPDGEAVGEKERMTTLLSLTDIQVKISVPQRLTQRMTATGRILPMRKKAGRESSFKTLPKKKHNDDLDICKLVKHRVDLTIL